MAMRLPPIGRTLPWFLLMLLAKFLLAALFIAQSMVHSPDSLNDYGITISKDYSELLGPVDNYFSHGSYALEPGSDEPYTGRLPGYSAPYLLLNYLFSPSIALLLLIIIQLALSAFATVRIAQCLYGITLKRGFFLFTLILVGFFQFALPWETWTYPESLGLSVWLLAVYHFYKSWGSARWWHFLLAGFFMAWAFFLRGFLGVYYLAFGFAFVWQWFKISHRKRLFAQVALFLLPLILFESAWVIRNKISTGKLILLQTSFGWGEEDDSYHLDKAYKPSMLQLRELIACWGGDNVHYYPGSDMSYFTMREDPGSFFPFRDEIFDEELRPDSLRSLRALVQTSFNTNLDLAVRLSADEQLKEKSERLQTEFKSSRPGYFYLKASFYKLKNLVVQNVVGNWPGPSFSASPLLYKIYKLIVLTLYFGGIILGGLFSIWLIFRNNQGPVFHVLWMSTGLLIVCFTLLINTAEFKYFMTGGLNLSLIALLGLADLLSLQRRKKSESL